jgi:hypothetical protein
MDTDRDTTLAHEPYSMTMGLALYPVDGTAVAMHNDAFWEHIAVRSE